MLMVDHSQPARRHWNRQWVYPQSIQLRCARHYPLPSRRGADCPQLAADLLGYSSRAGAAPAILSRLVRRWGQCEGPTERDAVAQTRARLGNARMARNRAGSDSSCRLSLSAGFLNRSTYRGIRFGVPLYATRYAASAVYLSPGHAFGESSNRDWRARQIGH